MIDSLDESTPRLAIDLGEPVKPVRKLTKAGVRRIAITKQRGICAGPGCGKAPTHKGKPYLDVVTRADGTGIAFCRSCRLRWDGKPRAAKGAETRRLNQGRPTIGVPRSRHAVPAPDVYELLITAALTTVHVEGRQTPPRDAMRELVRDLVERGMLAPAPLARRRQKPGQAVQDGADTGQIQFVTPI